jgi:diacylglycerol kinase family enzyme
MYYYILDLGDKNILKIKEKMEMLMASFGISGDFGKISPLSSAYDLAKKAKEQRYSTIVAIGGNEIINQTASALINSNTTMGIIPIGASQTICDLIGAYTFKDALEILRARKIETVDLGKISESKYFITEAKILNPQPVPTVLDFGKFKIGGKFKEIIIANGTDKQESFKDGVLDILIDKKEKKSSFLRFFQKPLSAYSIFHQEFLNIETEEQANVSIDNEIVAKTPCEIKILPLALKLIVARII